MIGLFVIAVLLLRPEGLLPEVPTVSSDTEDVPRGTAR
jgi:ABC-type branched-subunit amino acid transport system permease subunit